MDKRDDREGYNRRRNNSDESYGGARPKVRNQEPVRQQRRVSESERQSGRKPESSENLHPPRRKSENKQHPLKTNIKNANVEQNEGRNIKQATYDKAYSWKKPNIPDHTHRGRHFSESESKQKHDNQDPNLNQHPRRRTSESNDDGEGQRKGSNNVESGKANHVGKPSGDKPGSSRSKNNKENESKRSGNDTVRRKMAAKAQKAKMTMMYVIICDTVNNTEKVKDYIHHRMGNKRTFDFNVKGTEKMKGKNEGCTLVTMELSSFSKASAATNLLNKSNRGSSSKVYCYSDKHKALGDNIQPTQKRTESVKAVLGELLEATRNVLGKHDEKIANQQQVLEQITKRLSSRRGLPFELFERLSNEHGALNDKLSELQKQRNEFQHFLVGLNTKITDVMNHDKYEKELGEIRKALGVECRRLEAALPMYARREDILSTIRDNQVCVILGETGSGKSTQMVQYLHQAGFGEKGMIACTQPRKIAATSLAIHVSKEMASSVGQTVGYQVGMQTKKSGVTKVMFMTDHIMLNECLADRLFSKYSCIVIDEAHERSIHTDLLLGLLKKALPSRPDLRVVVTSATIDPDVFVRYFGGPELCPVIKVSGRAFPVEVIWDHDDLYDAPYPDSYEAKALGKAIEIHKNTAVTEGDILVFVTSVVETERCVERFKERVGDADSLCLMLHGRLKPEEQQMAFEPPPKGKRKVIFATNIAETSITIDGIKFVVDTGVAKEMRFDPKKNMSSLDVVTISQSSANQRKGRAGRTSSGTCYRLYAEHDYNKLTKSGSPEILRIQVSQAMLKLLQLKVNPLDFDYVQSPSQTAMNFAIDRLKELEAVSTDGKITDLGEWIARLPVEPSLGVMIKKGIDLGIPSEALVVASCCSQSGIFFRVGTQEEKKEADMKKMKFCHEGGDLLTMLTVYRQWDQIDEKKKGNWCSNNSVNGKAMKAVREMNNEIMTILKKEADLKIKHQFIETSEGDNKVLKLIFDCMRFNLGFYLGHESAGFLVVKQNQRVQMHPSSALVALGSQPTWVVFNKVLNTSADFITEVTLVSQELFEEAKLNGKIVVDEMQLNTLKVSRIRTFPVGRHVFWKFVGPMHRNRKEIEASIREVCNDSVVVIEASKLRSEITLFCVPLYGSVAADMLNESIKPLPQQLRNERIEESINDKKGENVGVRAILGNGGAVVEILMQEQFRSLHIKEKAFNQEILTEQELTEQLSYFGPIEQLWKTTGKRNANSEFWGRVTFTRESDAKAAKGSINEEEESNFTLVPITYRKQTTTLRQEFTLKLRWCRRPGKGHCYVKVKRPEDIARLLSTTVIVDGDPVRSELSRRGNESVMFKGLPHDVTENEILSAIEEALELPNGGGKSRFDIIVPRENLVFNQGEHDQKQRKLVDILSTMARVEEFRVRVINYGPKTATVIAFVTFFDVPTATAVHRRITSEYLAIDGHEIKADFEHKSSIHVNIRIYKIIRDELDALIHRYKSSKSTNVNLRELKSGHFSVDIKSTSLEKLAKTKVRFDNTVQGQILSCGEVDDLHVLFTREGRQKIQNIEKSTGTVISVDGRQMLLTIQGSFERKTQAKQTIVEEIKKQASNQEREVRLKGDDTPPGLLKALFGKYGLKFHKLKSETGLSSIMINMRRHEVVLVGGEEALEKAQELVKKEREDLMSRMSSQGFSDVNLPDCPVCLCPVEESDMNRLEFCGHAYCKYCLTNLMKSSIEDRKFPIVCIAEKCEQQLVIRDLNSQIKFGTIKRHTLAKNAIECFVQQNNQQYKFCLTPDCQMVYRVTKETERFSCALCFKNICTACHCEFHDGLTCAMYESFKKGGGDDTLMAWIREDPGNRKRCPRCGFGIEKIDGCDHMTCKCGAHICWKCTKGFSTSKACYGHLRSEHGSFV